MSEFGRRHKSDEEGHLHGLSQDILPTLATYHLFTGVGHIITECGIWKLLSRISRIMSRFYISNKSHQIFGWRKNFDLCTMPLIYNSLSNPFHLFKCQSCCRKCRRRGMLEVNILPCLLLSEPAETLPWVIIENLQILFCIKYVFSYVVELNTQRFN